MNLPEALAWLEESSKSWTHSSQQVYAKTILDEVRRLEGEVVLLSTEIERREEIRVRERAEHVALVESFQRLKEEATREREAADAAERRASTAVTTANEKYRQAETLLKDIHYGLLRQPELTREELAAAITSLVNPYPEGAKA